jgi:hypothetical protein
MMPHGSFAPMRAAWPAPRPEAKNRLRTLANEVS